MNEQQPENATAKEFSKRSFKSPYINLLEIRGVGHGKGWAEMALDWREELVGDEDAGLIASGAIFSLMDSVAGMALFGTMQPIEPIATLDLRVDYVRPANRGATIHGRVDVVKITRRVAFIRGIAHDGDPERPVANVTGTFMRTSSQ